MIIIIMIFVRIIIMIFVRIIIMIFVRVIIIIMNIIVMFLSSPLHYHHNYKVTLTKIFSSKLKNLRQKDLSIFLQVGAIRKMQSLQKNKENTIVAITRCYNKEI